MAINEEHLSIVVMSMAVMFSYKGRHFNLQVTEDNKREFVFTEVQKDKTPTPDDMLTGALETSEIATAKIFWDGDVPSDPLVREAMDVITGYLVERNLLAVSKGN